ncbi:MAG: hypothetical protein ACXVO9_10965 [Bacteroidia bacterium]
MIAYKENQYGIAENLPQIRKTSKLRFEMTGAQFFDLFIRASSKTSFEVYIDLFN